MKPKMLVLMSTITLLAALTVPTRTAAQEAQQGAEGVSNVDTGTGNPVPLINQPLVPDAAKPGGAAFTLTVKGTGFVSGAVVKWNGSARTTTFVNGSRLKAAILASDIAKAGTASVTVVNPSPSGGTSNVAFLSITAPTSSWIFGERSDFSTGSGPNSVATGDFNKDGRLDLALSNYFDNTVSVLLGNGDGTFKAHVDYATQLGPDSVVVGDFNGDGKLDLAVRNQSSNTVSVLLGNGDGTFQPAANFAVGSGTSSSRVAAGDFNGDGKLDLAATNYNDNTVSILLGNGDGTFQGQVVYPAGSGTSAIAVGDFNADGRLDLAILNNANNAVAIIMGNGDGTFQAPVQYSTGSAPAWVNVADLNGDGILDLVVPNSGANTVSILLGKGDGTFQPHVDYAVPTGAVRSQVADLNGDGKPDLAIAPWLSSNVVSILLGKGDGTFKAATTYPTGSSPEHVVAGDFNGDGRLDLAVPDNGASTVSVLLQSTVSLSGTSLKFADQVVETSSPSQTVTLTNLGPQALTINSIAITGTDPNDFSQTNTCGSSVAPQGRCTIAVTFTPTEVGPRTASVTITDNAVGSPQQIALSGTGVVSGPNATLSPTSLTFPVQLVGTTSPAQSVTLTDYGTVALSITSIGFTGADPHDFAQTNNCGSSVAPGATCTISVTFTPKGINARTASLSTADNAPGSPQKVGLTGTGTVVKLNPTSLSFSCYPRGAFCKCHSTGETTLTNTGNTALNNNISISGPFSQTNNCPTSLAAGQSCTITVQWRVVTGTGALSISDNGGGSPQTVPLTGTDYCPFGAASAASVVKSSLAEFRTAVVPSPSKSSPVGTRIMDLTDSTRDDPFLGDGTKRELLARFWYPASLDKGCNPAQYASTAVWSYSSQLAGVPFPEVKANSCLDAPITDGAHPVVIFTHGYTGTFTDYTFLFEDLASRGYVVASVDHTYEATAVEFPDGRFVKSVLGSHWDGTWQTDEQTLSFAVSVRFGDLRFVVDELERLNAESGSPFARKLDTSRLAVAGHSLGGMTALPALLQDTRFRAGILIDGWPDSLTTPTDTPVLILAAGHQQWSDGERGLWDNLRGPRLAVNLRGSEHVTPSDLVWLAKGAVKTGTMGPEKTIAAVRDYIAAFLDVNLRGKPMAPLLTGPSSEYPDAVVTTQNQSLSDETPSAERKAP